MDDFRIIYRILRELQRAMDSEEFDVDRVSHEAMGCTRPRWNSIMAMLAKGGYVEGVTVRKYADSPSPRVLVKDPAITLKGLEYLQENSLMRKAADLATGIAEIIP